ncbi:MAG: fasciclin domain-containing protein [Adhaeribacter sp.]
MFYHSPFPSAGRKPLLVLCWLLAFSLAGCQDGFDKYWQYQEQQEGFLFTKIKEDPQFSTFAQALEKTGVGTALNKAGVFTVFAPTNEAFREYLAAAGYDDIDEVPVDQLTSTVNYHIVYFTWYLYDVQKRYKANRSDVFYLNRSAKYLELTVDESGENTFQVNGVEVAGRDFQAENGVIHAIRKVLPVRANIDQTLGSRAEFATFYKLTEVLADYRTYDPANSTDRDGDGRIDSAFFKSHPPLGSAIGLAAEFQVIQGSANRGVQHLTTVLAPTNAVLDAYLAPVLPRFHNRIDSLPQYYVQALLQQHIFGNGRLIPAENLLAPTAPLVPLSGTAMNPTIKAADLTLPDIRVSNGVIHGISRVLESSRTKSAIGQAMKDPELRDFIQALNRTGLLGTYAQSTAAFTVLAPTNAAFAAAGLNVKKMTLNGQQMSTTELTNIIRQHVLTGDLPKSKLVNGNYASVLVRGTAVPVKVSGTTVATTTTPVYTANVLQYDLKGESNGWLHKIDAVLLPTPI